MEGLCMTLTDLRIGDVLRNLHTQESHPIQDILDVEMGVNKTIKVWVINGNRWDSQSMKRGWQI